MVYPFRYNDKELDSKNGLNWYDYGARHYDATLGRWHVVDPLADKYYGYSPYVYCANSPLLLVDPDGCEIVIGSLFGRILAFLGVNNFENKVQHQISQLKKDDSVVSQMINRLEQSDKTISIKPINVIGNKTIPDDSENITKPQGSTIQFNPDERFTRGREERDPRIGLVHELGHADDLANGKAKEFNYGKAMDGNLEEQAKSIENERHAIEMENRIRKVEGLKLRNPEDYYKKINKKNK